MIVSIQLMSPVSGDYSDKEVDREASVVATGFHSINVPSEWGLSSLGAYCQWQIVL